MLHWVRQSQSIAAKAVRFGLVGAVSSAIYTVIAVMFVDGLGFAPEPSSILAYLGSLPLNFLANRTFAFHSQGTVQGDATRFVVMHAAGMAIAYGSMVAATVWFGGHYLIGVAFAVVLVPAFNFLAANFWVFRHQRKDEDRLTQR